MNNGNGWTSASTFDAASYTTNQIAQRGTRNSSSFGDKVEHVVQTWGYNVVGINVNQIDSMREAIKTYVSEIEQYLDGIDPKVTADNAFKSEAVQDAVERYITKVKEYCINLTTQLLAFSDKLVDIQKAYKQSMTNLAGDIDAQNSAFSEGRRYQQQWQ